MQEVESQFSHTSAVVVVISYFLTDRKEQNLHAHAPSEESPVIQYTYIPSPILLPFTFRSIISTCRSLQDDVPQQILTYQQQQQQQQQQLLLLLHTVWLTRIGTSWVILFYEYLCGCSCQNWCGIIFQPTVTILSTVLDWFLPYILWVGMMILPIHK